MAATEDSGLRLRLEFQATDEPIVGRVLGPDGSSRPFQGWLELVAAVDAFRAAQAAPR